MNPIEFLTAKKRHLCSMKQQLQQDHKRTIDKLDKEIADVDRALNVIDETTRQYICPRCNGTGTIRCPDAAGQMDNYKCPTCGGTGIKLADIEEKRVEECEQ